MNNWPTLEKTLLHELTEQFSSTVIDCEQILKITFYSRPILAFSASEGKTIVCTDSINMGLETVLS